MDYNKLAAEIHQQNIDAGWWKQREAEHIGGGTELITIPRNIGELLCLTHSELSEAWIGWSQKLPDDHLPQYPMAVVELADTAIRVFDILGYYSEPKAHFIPVDILDFPEPMEVTFDLAIVACHAMVSGSMEAFRKSDVLKGKMILHRLLDTLRKLSAKMDYDLAAVIEDKREYNRHRADHKLEARARADGKKF